MTVDPQVAGERIGALLDELAATLDGRQRAALDELLALVAQVHGTAVVRVLDAAGPRVRDALADDPLVATLLAAHRAWADAGEVAVALTPRVRCDLCGVAVPADHRHVVRLRPRGLACACVPCHLLLGHEGAGGGTHLAVPDRWAALGPLGAAWDALDLPVGVAFVVRDSAAGRPVASYPGPAGVTESQLPLDGWDAVVGAHPVLATLADDVEALLVRHGPRGSEGYVVPVDACYELAGRLRRLWQGFDGGPEARAAVEDVFARARRRAPAAVAP